MNKDEISKNFWPALSFTLLFVFFNLFMYIYLALDPNFSIYIVIIITNLILAAVFLFFELTGIREGLWKFWISLPKLIHKIISAICLFWIISLVLKAFIPALKKDYEKN